MAKIEKLQYKVIKSENKIQIRSYEPYILAEISVQGDRNEAANKAFTVLFKYISGNNISGEKISMTSPVTQQGEKIAMTAPVEQSGDGKNWKITFTMPSKYTMQTIPKPKDGSITIYQTDKEQRIAIMFSGFWNDANFNKHKKKLDEYIAEHDLKIKGGAIYAYYNSPFTLPFLRHNEVMYVLT